MADHVLDLAQALIRCRSVTPADDGALAVIGDWLERAGFAVHRPTLSESGADPVENLFARIGSGSPFLALAGHTDVVPPGDPAAWRHEPFAGTLEDGFLYGRGAVDMKGAVAAMTAAAVEFVAERGPDFGGSLAFLLTGDEEGPAVDGTVKLLAWAAERGERFDACLLGEPTSVERLGDTIKVGRRGSLTGRLAVHGRQGHVAYPHLAENPIPILARLVAALSDEPLDGGTDRFDPSILQWTTLDVGNPATNVIPGLARAVFNVRFSDRWTAASLAAEIRARVERAGGGASYELAFDPTNSPAFVTKPGAFLDIVREAVTAETGIDPALSTSGGTSDARFISAYCPVVELGPVGETMHAVDERVRVADLERLVAIYGRVLRSFFDRPAA